MGPTGFPSPDSQLMLGGGLPPAEQSMRAPVSLAKSTRDGGSFRKDGPTKEAAAVGTRQTDACYKLSSIQGSSHRAFWRTKNVAPKNGKYFLSVFHSPELLLSFNTAVIP
jgi:hypothetical protein